MVQVTSRRVGGVPASVSSVARDIVRQPACAAASSSSGLVFPSTLPTRVGSENGSSLKAPVSAEIRPCPRATFPSQLTSAERSIRGISLLRWKNGQRAVGVIGLGRRARGTEDAEEAELRLAGVRQAVDEAGGQVHAGPGAQLGLLAADVERALTLEHVDHLVVGVEVIGRAAGRDQPDELRHGGAAALGRQAEEEM